MTERDRAQRIVRRFRDRADRELAARLARGGSIQTARAIVGRTEPGTVVIEVDQGGRRARSDSTPPPPLTAHLPREPRLDFDTSDVDEES